MSSSSPVTGERSREAEELYRAIAEAGVLDQTVMVFGQMNAPAGGFDRVVLVYNRPVSDTRYAPAVQQLLPFQPEWLAALKRRRWPGRRVPEPPWGPHRAFWLLAREVSWPARG